MRLKMELLKVNHFSEIVERVASLRVLGFENLASLERTRFLGGKGVPKAEFLATLPFKKYQYFEKVFILRFIKNHRSNVMKAPKTVNLASFTRRTQDLLFWGPSLR